VEGLEARELLANAFLQTNLVSDISGIAQNTDSNLVNPWGLASSPTGPIWVADNHNGVSTIYNSQGQTVLPPVTIPPPNGSPPGTVAAPTGTVFNGSSDFKVSENGKSAPALFLFATEDGTISGWSFAVDLGNAILKVDNSASGAVYKGLAEGTDPDGRNLLFATNFNAGTIDVFDRNFQATTVGGDFQDPNIPTGFAPFGIQNIGGKLYVTYAKQDEFKHDDVAGPGNGFVDVFDTNGHLLKRFASGGTLNSPWGLAVAPRGFGDFGGDLLVGDFGDGRINVFDAHNGQFRGQLNDPVGRPITIGGLWALRFGNGTAAGGASHSLFFTAGLNHEGDGLFGTLDATRPLNLNGGTRSDLYFQTNIASDVAGLAQNQQPDMDLLNPWGLTAGPKTPFWISDNNGGVSTLYNGAGQKQGLRVTIPPLPGSAPGTLGDPTGIVFNGNGGFNVTENGNTGSSAFIFASESGIIYGWNFNVDRNNAIIAVNHFAQGADYTGLALASMGGSQFLYAANFGQGSIDVFNSSFTPVMLPGAFHDPNLPSGFVPYNIATINGQLYVTYENPNAEGAGNGIIDVYTTAGMLVERFATGGPLASPWGMVMAPSNFGRFSNMLLVGNEDDGHISAYDPRSRAFVGQLNDMTGHPIAISGLWGLSFGNNNAAGSSSTLFFTAGIGDYQHGLFGSLQATG
jgi:uncharacterized protein (TIGR03118 family)